MTNEELIEKFEYESTDTPKTYHATTVLEMLDAARKDEAIEFGKFLFEYETVDTTIDYLYRHRKLKGNLFYPEELYTLFKNQNK